MSAPYKPRRGDLVALVEQSTYTIQAVGKLGHVTREKVTLGVITSMGRDGMVKAWRDLAYEDIAPTRRDRFRGQVLTIPARFDVDEVTAAYRARRYPTAPHSDMVPPFETTGALRAFLADYMGEEVAL